MNIDEKIKEINNTLKRYCRYLNECSPLFLDEVEYFAYLNSIFKQYCEIFHIDKCLFTGDINEALTQNIPMTTSLEYAKAYFHDTYDGLYDEEIEKMITSGIISMRYKGTEEDKSYIEDLKKKIENLEEELKEIDLKLKALEYKGSFESEREDLELKEQIIKNEIKGLRLEIGGYNNFSCGNTRDNHSFVNLPCNGTIDDAIGMVHEIRHQLNNPLSKSNVVREIYTESISLFEELNCIDYFQKFCSKEELNLIRMYRISTSYRFCSNFDIVSFLIFMYDKLGKVSIENYKFYTGNDDSKNIEELLSKNLHFDIKEDYIYIFGIVIAIYMYQKAKENLKFLPNIIKLNEEIKKDPIINESEEFFELYNIIGLNPENFEDLRVSLKKEFEWFKSLYETEDITR